MPTRLYCQCGQSLEVPGEYKGSAVACPKCGARVPLPARQAASAEAPRKGTKRRRPQDSRATLYIACGIALVLFFACGVGGIVFYRALASKGAPDQGTRDVAGMIKRLEATTTDFETLGLTTEEADSLRRSGQAASDIPLCMQVVDDIAALGDGAVEPLVAALKGGTKPPIVVPNLKQRVTDANAPEDMSEPRRLTVDVNIGNPSVRVARIFLGRNDAPRDWVSLALIRLGPAALPAVRKLLDDELVAVRSDAESIVRHIDPDYVHQTSDANLVEAMRRDLTNPEFVARDLIARGPAVIPLLKDSLSDPVQRVRFTAALALQKMGDAAEPAIPDLLARLTEDDSQVRFACLQAIANSKARGPEVAAALVGALKINVTTYQDRALDILAKTTWTDSATTEGLVDYAVTIRATDQRVGAMLRGHRAKALGMLAKHLSSQTATHRANALQWIKALGPDRSVETPLTSLLDDPALRRQAALILCEGESIPDRAVDVLIEEIKPETSTYKVNVDLVDALKQAGSKSNRVAPLIAARLNDPAIEPFRRDVLLEAAVGTAGASAESAASLLNLVAKSNERDAENAINRALASFEPASASGQKEVVDMLTGHVEKGENPAVQRLAIGLLGKMGAGSDDVIQALIKIWKNPRREPDPAIVEASIAALASIGAPALKPVLDLADSSRVETRRTAIRCIQRMQQQQVDVVSAAPALVKAMRDNDVVVRGLADATLAPLGPAAIDVAPTLEAYAKARDRDLSKRALGLLDRIDPDRARKARALNAKRD